MIPIAAQNVDITQPLSNQQKPAFVCEPGDPRVREFGWVRTNFRGYLSIEDNTIWISSIWSIHGGRGNLSKLIKNIHRAGYEIKVPSPFPKMEAICIHLGFRKTEEDFPEMGSSIIVYILDRR